MASLTADCIFVYFMGTLIFSFLVARYAPGTIFDFLLGIVHHSVSVHFTLFVAIHTHHAFLIMNIGRSPVFTGKFRINTSAVTRGAGSAFILLDEFMALQKAGGNAGNRRRFDMTVAAGRMTAPAGLIKDLSIKGFEFFRRESMLDSFTLTKACIMKRLSIVIRDLSMTYGAGFKIIGWPGNKSRVG
jgi:hypothetical protein